MAWQWEGDWQIETTLDGQPLDHDVNMITFIFNLFCFVNLIFTLITRSYSFEI